MPYDKKLAGRIREAQASKAMIIDNILVRIFVVCNFTHYMIKSIRHKGLRLLWTNGDGSKLPAEMLLRIKFILDAINRAEVIPQDFSPFPGWRIHPLKGNYKGFWSLTVSGNWRIIFRFEKGNAVDVDFVDYH